MRKKQNRQITMKPGQTIDIGPSVKIEPQEPAQTLREFAETVVSKMAESLEVPLDSIDYESPPNFSLARVIRQASLEAITHEPEPRRFMPRDCTQCLTRRKPGESYVRVYSKHGRIRYCRCSLCGNTWAQEGE